MNKRIFVPFFMLALLFSVLFGNQMILPSTANSNVSGYEFGDTTEAQALRYPSQRKIFYASGRHWIFYSNGMYIVYKTSVDGITWTLGDSNPITAGVTGDVFSIWFDQTYLHYACADPNASVGLLYRRGFPNADGTITWSAAEQTAVDWVSGIILSLPFVAVDTENHPWIVYRRQEGIDYYPYVTRSSNTNGTWSTDTNFPFELCSDRSLGWISTITPLKNHKMYVVSFSAVDNYRRGRLWNGTAWENEESPITVSSINCAPHSIVAQDDDIHLAFLDTPNHNIIYRKRFHSSSSWGTEVTIRANTTYTSDPILTIDTVANNLYCSWMGSPSSNFIYYKSCINGTWDGNPIVWIDATSGCLAANDAFSGYYEIGQDVNYIGLAYLAGSSSHYNITFACLPLYRKERLRLDLALFLQCYKGQAPPEAMCLADLGGGMPPQLFNYDGKVDSIDLALFIQSYKS